MKKVKIIKDYLDTTMNMKLVKAGTELEVDEKRADVLIQAGKAQNIEANKSTETKTSSKAKTSSSKK